MSVAKPIVKRTYGSQIKRTYSTTSSSSDTTLSSPPTRETSPCLTKRKRPLLDAFVNYAPPSKKPTLSNPTKSLSKVTLKKKKKAEALTQLHFITDEPTLRTCSLCDLSYTRGAPDDEALHKSHCARVQKGMEWGKEDERERALGNGHVTLIAEDIKVSKGEYGRIIAVKPTTASKVGLKVGGFGGTIKIVLTKLADSRILENREPCFVGARHPSVIVGDSEGLSLPPTRKRSYKREDRRLCAGGEDLLSNVHRNEG